MDKIKGDILMNDSIDFQNLRKKGQFFLLEDNNNQ